MRLRVGLTGGIGSGKSEVAKIFADLGAHIIDADELARAAVVPGSVGLARIAARWPQVVAADGALNRAGLAAIIFADRAARDELGAIVHPLVRELAALREAAAGPGQIVIHDVPLLFEAGFYRACDANVLVVADLATRLGRLVVRGLDPEEVERRMAAQIDPQRARELADYVIDNDGTIAALHAATVTVFDDLRERIATISRSHCAPSPENDQRVPPR